MTLGSAVVADLLPTPNAADGTGGRHNADGHQDTLPGTVRVLPTPTARDWKDGTPLDAVETNGLLGRAVWPDRLLPTPVVNDMGEGKTVERWDEWTDDLKGASLAIEAARLLPTPTRADGEGGRTVQTEYGNLGQSVKALDVPVMGDAGEEVEDDGGLFLADLLKVVTAATKDLPTPTTTDANGAGSAPGSEYRGRPLTDATVRDGEAAWGAYAPAIRRWETIRGPAPAPTEPNAKGNPRLAPTFVEWMMGLDPGHVTDTPRLGRPAQLKALGNGVVPQQAAEAYRRILTRNPAPLAALLRNG